MLIFILKYTKIIIYTTKGLFFLIVCYRDDNGEIICEGFDESPRFHQQLHIIQGLIFSYQSSICNQPLFVVLVLYCNLK
jgi:hypothetical protein